MIKSFHQGYDLLLDEKNLSFLVIEGLVTMYKKSLIGYDFFRSFTKGECFVYHLSLENDEIKKDSRLKAEVSQNDSIVLVQVKEILTLKEINKPIDLKESYILDQDDDSKKYILKDLSLVYSIIDSVVNKIKALEFRSTSCNEILKNFLHKNYHNPRVKEDLDRQDIIEYPNEIEGNLIKEVNPVYDMNSLSNNRSYNSTNGAFERPKEKHSSKVAKINLSKPKPILYYPYSERVLSQYDDMRKKYIYPSNDEILRYLLLRDFLIQFEELSSRIKNLIEKKFISKLLKKKNSSNANYLASCLDIKETIIKDAKFKDKITSKLSNTIGIAEKIKQMKSNEAKIAQNKITFKKEERMLLESLYCFKCRETPRNAISTCGHLMLCEFCIQNMKICPKCGMDIGRVSKIFRS